MHRLQAQKTSTEILHLTLLPNPPAVCLQALSLVSCKKHFVCSSRCSNISRKPFYVKIYIVIYSKYHTLSFFVLLVVTDFINIVNVSQFSKNKYFRFVLKFFLTHLLFRIHLICLHIKKNPILVIVEVRCFLKHCLNF